MLPCNAVCTLLILTLYSSCDYHTVSLLLEDPDLSPVTIAGSPEPISIMEITVSDTYAQKMGSNEAREMEMVRNHLYVESTL